MEELIRKKDALDALMAERKHLLANGQKGAEHVLTHHGYNVIEELDVPVINVGDMIYRQAAIDALCRGEGCGNICSRAIRAIPPVQPKHGKWKPRYYDVGADVYVEWACSECGYVRQKGREDGNAGEEPEADFCEKCGVKMDR